MISGGGDVNNRTLFLLAAASLLAGVGTVLASDAMGSSAVSQAWVDTDGDGINDIQAARHREPRNRRTSDRTVDSGRVTGEKAASRVREIRAIVRTMQAEGKNAAQISETVAAKLREYSVIAASQGGKKPGS